MTSNENSEIKEKICQRCLMPVVGAKKYCGLDNFASNCRTCHNSFTQKCQGRVRSYCSKSCQANDPELIRSANKKRVESGYLSENAKNTAKKIKEKYGVDNISQLDFVKEKKATNGVTGFARPEYKELIKEKYGVDNISQLQEVKDKKRQSSLDKYGVDNVSKAPEVIKKIETTMLSKYGVSTVLTLPENQLKSSQNNRYRISKVNRKWQEDLFDDIGVEFDFEQNVGDSFLADLGYENLRIDINPSISHSSNVSYPHAAGICTVPECSKKAHLPRERLYHQKRAIMAEANGLILLQYFDWYDRSIFMNIVESKLKRTSERIYARKTVLKEISQADANRFFKENHLLGGSNGQTLCLGLFYDDELVHCQTYGKARFSRKQEWEAIRSCSKINTQIIGGFSKCDKYFFNKINPASVISYVDLSTGVGETEAMFDGWSFSHITTPSAVWAKYARTEDNTDSPMFIKDSAVRRLSADKMLGFEVGEKYPRFDNEGNKITNDFVMASEGYMKVYDCGTKAFVYQP